MTDPTRPLADLDEVQAGLAAFLHDRLADVTGIAVDELWVSPNGFSNETALFDASWTDADGSHHGRYVLRCMGDGRGLFFETDVFHQWQMMEALAGHPGIPVPELVWKETRADFLGVPFFIMREVPGRVPPSGTNHHVAGWVTELSLPERGRLYDDAITVLTRIHAVDPADVAFLDRPQYGPTGLTQHLGWIRGWLEWTAAGRSFPVLERAVEWAITNQPEHRDVGLVWGDSRVGNMIFADDCTVAAVLDWEMATLGPPELDVAWWMMFETLQTGAKGNTRLAGTPTLEETVARYEELSGHTLRDLDYYVTLAWLRIGLTRTRMVLPGADQDPTEYSKSDAVMLGLAAQIDRVG